MESSVLRKAQALFGGEGLMSLSNQGLASYPTRLWSRHDCLNSSRGGTHASCGMVPSPMSDGIHELSERGYSLHQNRLVGNEKRCTEGLRTKRGSGVTWGSPKIREDDGDGAAIVIRRWETHLHGEVPQEATLKKRWLTRMCQQTIAGVALKRRWLLESLLP